MNLEIYCKVSKKFGRGHLTYRNRRCNVSASVHIWRKQVSLRNIAFWMLGSACMIDKSSYASRHL